MSEPKAWASTTRSAAMPPVPLPFSTDGTASHSKPLSPVRRRAATESDEYMSPAAVFSAFVGNDSGGGGGGGGGDGNKANSHGHAVLVHEEGRNASAAVSARPIPVSIHNVHKNNYNSYSSHNSYNSVHYRQRRQQQPAATPSSSSTGNSNIGGNIGGNTFYDLAEDSADDDVDRSDRSDDWGLGITSYTDSHTIDESQGRRRNVFEGRRQNRQQSEVTRPHPRTLQSWMNNDVIQDGDGGNNGYVSSGNNGRDLGELGTHPSQLIARTNPYNQHYTSSQHYNQRSQHLPAGSSNSNNNNNSHGHGQGHGHSYSYSYQYSQGRSSSRGHGHGHNASIASHTSHTSHASSAPRPLRQNHHSHPHPPRAASSLAVYNPPTTSPPSSPSSPSSPTTTARSGHSSSSSSRTWKASRAPKASKASKASSTSRTTPPKAPPRVSSLLPPPRSTSTTTTTNASPRLPLSAFTVTTPIATIPEQPSTFASTSISNFHPNTNPSWHPPSTTPTREEPSSSPPSSNVTLGEAPTHAQFASSFLDPLNQKPPDAASVLASRTGPGPGSGAAPGPGVGSSVGSGAGPGSSGAGPGPDPGPRARQPSHSRASSFGTATDSLRNLNRWSSSTASSRLSTWDYHHYQQQQAQQQAQQQKPVASARRMSIDSLRGTSQFPATVQPQSSFPPNQYSSPRKLTKPRFSQGTTEPPSTRSGPSPPPLLPPNLPPIVSLPPLDTNPESKLHPGSLHAMSRASPHLNTPNSVFASNAESQDYFWSDLSNPMSTSSPAMRSNTSLLPPAPVMRDRDVGPERKGHSRSRSAAKGGSGDSTKPKDRSNSKPSQKAMLSKALSKANTAVQLDNAQNYGAAREAYLEACELLQQVLARTNGDDDRKKLDAIRITYTSRIEELDALLPINPHGDKALPARPDSFDYHGVQMELAGIDNQTDTATITRTRRTESPITQVSSQAMHRPSESITYRDFSRNADYNQVPRQSSFSRSPMRRNFERSTLTLPRSSDDNFLPAPLSPRRPASPPRIPSPEPIVRMDFSLNSERLAPGNELRSHRRNLSHESASWLDPIDESGGSTTSSVHSRSSSRIMRKHIRQPSGDTEAEFDAALDAAVEAAYDDGYEPMETSIEMYDEGDDRIANSMRRVELAKERVRQTEREAAIEMAREHERQRQMSFSQQSQTYGGDFFDANDSDEEEERMLEEMTREFAMDDFTRQSRYHSSSVPRASSSSGLTSRTWHSSMASNPPTGITTLSVVSEVMLSGNVLKTASPPPMPPPTQSLPQPPNNRPPSTAGVRNRRLSGQNTKQLKIETSKLGPPPTMPPPPVTSSSGSQSQPTSNYIVQQRQALSASSARVAPSSMRIPSPPLRGVSPADTAGPASPPVGYEDEVRTGSPSSAVPGMRKNFSSSSLKSLKSRQMSFPHIDDADPLPMTPLSQQVSNSSVTRLPMMPALPTPIATTFTEKMTGGVGGLHLFDSDFHSPVAQSPNSTHHQQQNPDIPMPLEPCPSDPMFRPFWLMRALYQTLAHPRGGYISNRLFVPQDAWKVKGVKLRNIEDKISQCDLLTAGLLTLARVDSNDADAMLDEMQVLENLLETVQATLSRRLGTEVGTQGMITFRDDKETEPPPVPRNNSISGKGAFSWRRLRSKGSAVNLASTYGAKANVSGNTASSVPGIPERDAMSPGGVMSSLPMVAHPSSRPAKRDVASVKFDGPNANYMASLARLFDAAQTVDQIARQVDDPGLRHADKTQVGLELCTRHAAEFFGFYICRFVLTDLGMLLDKFVKRGSEWVLN